MIYGFNADEVFQMAIEIEENGKNFYEKAEKLVDDAAVKDLFHYLGIEEEKHKKKFTELKESIPAKEKESSVHDPGNEMNQYLKMMADMHVFRKTEEVSGRLRGIKNAEEALKMAIEFEKDSVIFFLSMQDAALREEGKKLIGQLVKEEQEHLRKLSVMLRKIEK